MADTAREPESVATVSNPRHGGHRDGSQAATHARHAALVGDAAATSAGRRFAEGGATHARDAATGLSAVARSAAGAGAGTNTVAPLADVAPARHAAANAGDTAGAIATRAPVAAASRPAPGGLAADATTSAAADAGGMGATVPAGGTGTNTGTGSTGVVTTHLLAVAAVPSATVAAAPAATTPASTAAAPAAFAFTAGDLVISVYGDGDGSGSYGDNQAAPIVLQELTTAGAIVGQMTLSQTTTTVNGVTEYAVSGEYGSSSEGTLELSADGQSLVIAGYAVNAATYNAGGATVYGNAALAQSTSIQGGQYAAVARVIADINANGVVDSSTALYNVFNTNNPRSVATVDGSSFFISGQGVKGDTTQGVFVAQDGAASATAIDTSTDTRTVEISNGALYVSRDSKQGPTSSISSYGGLPAGRTTATALPGIAGTVKLTAAQENSINASAVGTTVNLSPENYFFANSTTLYVADSGAPKTGTTLGDGGLQKWTLSGGTWTLDYTLSGGLNLVANSNKTGTTGLIGLAGQVTGNTVQLYATNATLADLDQTYLYGITDQLSAVTSPANESFTTLMTAAKDTNIRGVAFAPSDAPCFASGTLILCPDGERLVEDLRAGDLVLLPRENGRFHPAAIRWVGQRAVDVARHPDPGRVRPIRFAPDSIADGVPSRPLLLSPDHALMLDGVLVAARLLVNGVSVTVQDVATVRYVHVELERHDILLANNAPAESYLDTGNRHQFAGQAASSLHACFDRADHPDAFARLATDEATVRPIHRRLAERAGTGSAAPDTIRDPDLSLVLPDGRAIAPFRVGADGTHRFLVPEAEEAVSAVLRSRRQSPASLCPWLDDRRRLGVGVAAIRAWTRDGGLDALCLMPAPCATPPGWWPAGEGDPARWTDGEAVLPLPAGCVFLDVVVSATTEYAAAA